MKRFTTLLIAVLMLLSLLASCGEQPKEPPAFSEIPVSQSEEPGTEPASESVTEEAPATEEPLPSKYETEYSAPEDGSFTICGVPLSEYVPVLFFPTTEDYVKLNRKALLSGLKDPLSAATGSEWEFKVVKNDKYDTVKWAEHEILFGTNFHRDGMPETDLKKNYYGVTADGTVYFCSPSPMLYSYLWERFLEEFLGVEPGSGSASGGCAITECYRELPLFDPAQLKAQGYELVFEDNFDGDTLDSEVWTDFIHGGSNGVYSSISQVTVEDGNMVIRASYETDGEFGEGWYDCHACLRQKYARGYYEARVRCSPTTGRGTSDFYSAFWIEGPHPYDPEQSQGGIGPGGAEIDIMETFGFDLATCCIWVSGYEGNEGLSSEVIEVHNIGNNYGEEYHTFSLLWTEDVYEIFVDGIMIDHTSFGYGTSSVEETVIISLCGMDNTPSLDREIVRTMYTDYLRIWQKPE